MQFVLDVPVFAPQRQELRGSGGRGHGWCLLVLLVAGVQMRAPHSMHSTCANSGQSLSPVRSVEAP